MQKLGVSAKLPDEVCHVEHVVHVEPTYQHCHAASSGG